MKKHFKRLGWIYSPVSAAGWIITLLFAAIQVITLISIDSNYNSLCHSLIRFFPYFISISVVWYWIAANMSREE